MKRYQVTFTYYSGTESATDTFHFSSPQEARDKFLELRDVIEHNFDQCPDVETIDEPDFFAMRNLADASFAKVYMDT